MSSIRPLATITVLAFAGVLLYMKINETEPVLPDGVESWSIDQNIQIGGNLDESTDFRAAIPAATRPPVAGSAPPFRPDSVAGGSALDSDTPSAASSQAPAWSPETGATATPRIQISEGGDSRANLLSDESRRAGGEAAKTKSPDFPPLPELPTISSTPEPAALSQGQPVSAPEIGLQSTAPVSPPRQDGFNDGRPNVLSGDTSPQSEVAQPSLFAATQLAVRAALDRGELSQALLLLSDWYDDPSLSRQEAREVQNLLSQLAGPVIYSTEPRLEALYRVQAGETLPDIAKKYDVPKQLLAKINGIGAATQLQGGQELKVLCGPFSAIVDISRRKITLMLDRRYAGQFAIEFDPSISVEGQWVVNQKLLTPAEVGFGAAASTALGAATTPTAATAAGEDRSLTLSNSSGESSQLVILRGSGRSSPPSEPASRVIRLKTHDVADVFDILSLGSKVTIRR